MSVEEKLDHSPGYVHTTARGAKFFGCGLRRFLTLGALGHTDQNYHIAFFRRQVEFLSCLINSGDDRCTYDLRTISYPDPKLHTRGRIEAAVLCRLVDTNDVEAERLAQSFYRFLGASFEEYDFDPVPAAEIPALLAPFPPRHNASIGRRSGWMSLETMVGRPRDLRSLGFSASRDPLPRVPRDARAFHLFPLVPAMVPFAGLFKLLLLQPHPIMLTCRLRPVSLRAEEEQFLEQQIFLCERYAQVGLGQASEDISILSPTLQQYARTQQQYILRMLYALKNGAAHMAIGVSSPEPIAQTVVDLFGHLISQPGGAGLSCGADGADSYLAGGYQVYPHLADEVVDSAKSLDICGERIPDLAPSLARLPFLFGAAEAAAAFRFPTPSADALPGVETRRWRYLYPPPTLPLNGLRVGKSLIGGAVQDVFVAPPDRLRHIYIVGQTGTGKTTMLKSMISSDIENGNGVCVIDPHGDLFRWVLQRIPDKRLEDVLILDPADVDFPVGLNLLDCEGESHKHLIVQDLVGIIYRILQDDYGDAAGAMMGPVFFQHVRMNLLLVMSDPDRPGTLLDFYKIFVEPNYWKRWIPLKSHDPQLDSWVEQVLPRVDYFRTSDGIPFGGYIVSKFEDFVFDPMLRNIFGQKRSTVNLQQIMDAGKILLVNLAKGELSDVASRFLGMVLLSKLQASAMGRVKIPLEERRPFFVYVDEFQNIATQSFITMLSEGRKFGLGLVLANQFISQLKDRRITESIFGNVGSLICFRLGQADAESLEKFVAPGFSRSDLTNLPNWYSIMSTLVNGQTVQPFSIETELGDLAYDLAREQQVRAFSRRKHSRSKADVEDELGYQRK